MANLAAGRVIIAVVKDAIVVGTLENPIEAETRPPTPVEIETSRVGSFSGRSTGSHRRPSRTWQDSTGNFLT